MSPMQLILVAVFSVHTLEVAVLRIHPLEVPDTVVVLASIERDLTGDGIPETLQVVGTGETIDSLDVRFTIESSGRLIFETDFAPMTPVVGFDAGRRRLSPTEHRERLDEFGEWFFSDGKFMQIGEFETYLERWGPRFLPGVAEAIARELLYESKLDSLMAEGYPRPVAERQASRRYGVPLDTVAGQAIWDEMRNARVTIFSFSPGGDRSRAIGWSAKEQRFFDLVECC